MAGTSFITDSSPAGDFESLTVSTVALPCTASKIHVTQAGGFHKRAVKAFVSVETNSIRIRYDGTAPTASIGHLFTSGSSFTIEGESNVSNLQMIRASADATVMITYYFNR